jgi:hypothetical protein
MCCGLDGRALQCAKQGLVAAAVTLQCAKQGLVAAGVTGNVEHCSEAMYGMSCLPEVFEAWCCVMCYVY